MVNTHLFHLFYYAVILARSVMSTILVTDETTAEPHFLTTRGKDTNAKSKSHTNDLDHSSNFSNHPIHSPTIAIIIMTGGECLLESKQGDGELVLGSKSGCDHDGGDNDSGARVGGGDHGNSGDDVNKGDGIISAGGADLHRIRCIKISFKSNRQIISNIHTANWNYSHMLHIIFFKNNE